MTELEKKRKTAELMRVQAAKAEMEFRICEMQDQIAKLHENISNQEKREHELKGELTHV